MHSNRFNLPIIIAIHARRRMIERNISESILIDIIETGYEKYSDKSRLWVFKYYAERSDNLICAALVLEDSVVIKTVMHHFSEEE